MDETERGGDMATTGVAPGTGDGRAQAEAVAWYSLAPAEVADRLGVDPASGLTAAAAE